jgi:putative transposase
MGQSTGQSGGFVLPRAHCANSVRGGLQRLCDLIRTPIRAPQANAYAERFVRTVRGECLDRLLLLGRRHLEHVLSTSVTHYNSERPHRALALVPPEAVSGDDPPRTAAIERRDLLGGLIHEYRAAA